MGSLLNMKPYTNYSTSINPTYSDDSNSKLTKDLGFVLTWSAAPSSPALTSVTISGPESIMLSWKAPETTNGILEEYDAQCYRPGSDWPSSSRRANAQTLSTEVLRLVPNTLYECAVIASTQQISWGQGGGKKSSARSSPIRTWPGTAEQIIVKQASAVGPDSLFMEWWKPNVVHGILDHYRVKCSLTDQTNGEKETQVPSDMLSATISGLLPNTEYKCTVEAFVKPNEQNQGGGYNQPSYPKTLTTWPDVPTEPTAVTVSAINSTAVQVDWQAPVTANGEITKYRVLVYDTVESLETRSFEVQSDVFSFVLNGLPPFKTVHLAVQAYTKPNRDGLGGGFGKVSTKMSVTFEEAVLTVSTIGLGTSVDNLAKLEDKDSNDKMDKESTGTTQTASALRSPAHEGDRSEPNLTVPSESNNNVITVYTTGLEESSAADHHLQFPSESNEKGILPEFISEPAAIALTIGGLVSLLALATGLSRIDNGKGTPDTPVLSDVIAGRTGLRQNTNADLGLKDSQSDFIRTHATTGYLEAAVAESRTETPRETGFPPAAIAITICGILSFLALAIGISAMLVRRRRRREFDFNFAVEGDESVSKNSLNA